MGESTKWQLLEACPIADEAEWLRHAVGFATTFVIPAKRQRWGEMLVRRPQLISRDSHKLHSDLDRRTCHRVAGLPAEIRGDGLFYSFFDVPRVVPTPSVALAAAGGDAIFSLIPAELALYFFHEDEVWLCRA